MVIKIKCKFLTDITDLSHGMIWDDISFKYNAEKAELEVFNIELEALVVFVKQRDLDGEYQFEINGTIYDKWGD